jgi:hypothetical protein
MTYKDCRNCKHGLNDFDKEPCLSCEFTNWEPEEETVDGSKEGK